MSKKRWITLPILFLLLILLGTRGLASLGYASSAHSGDRIYDWQIKWEASTGNDPTLVPNENDPGWISIKQGEAPPARPNGYTAAWVQLKLPDLNGRVAILDFDKIFALKIKMYVDQKVIFESNRDYLYNLNQIALPLYPDYSGKTLKIWLETAESFSKLGIAEPIKLRDYEEVASKQVPNNLLNNMIGGGLLFLALTALICGVLQGKQYRKIWLPLGFILLCTSGLILSLPLLAFTNQPMGKTLSFTFDASLAIGLLMLTVFFENVFGPGKFSLIRYFRWFQVFYSVLCVLISGLIDFFKINALAHLYLLFTAQLFGLIIIVQFVLLLISSITYVFKGFKDAIIFTVGFMLFALIGLAEMVWYYISDKHYVIHYWKWGLLGFVVALVIIVGRTVALSYRQLVKYSKELELFNNQLQRSEKMDIISELAASVAHEVRNPLQVTRGFLQLLDGKYSSATDKTYVKLALNELDRAANIITDFLTFAKPGIEDEVTLNLAAEFEQVESILQPLAHLQGGRLSITIPNILNTRGNPPKFKQAIVNIVKNSIEAFKEEGTVEITARSSGDDILISIKDNGEGMGEEEIARLGEPYFSNKTKGTGLGLMVTFRIIEAMRGTIHFKSQKGKGTEVLIRLPKAPNPAPVPDADKRK